MNTEIIQIYISLLVVSCLTFSCCTNNQPFNYDCGPEIELDIEVKDFHSCLTDYGHIKITPLTGTPPYNYFWSNAEDEVIIKHYYDRVPTHLWYKEHTTQNRYKLFDGNYFLTITDAEGGYATKEIKVNKKRTTHFTIDEQVNTTAESNLCNGSIKITPKGKYANKVILEYIFVGPDNYGAFPKQSGSVELKNLCRGKYMLIARKNGYCHSELKFMIE